MKILGAILAGGRSTRFGSDKAAALIDGKPLIAHVAEALAPQVDALVICGRDWPGLASIPDRPAPDQGPLGGLCAALHHARENGFDAVLTAGCDVLPVPSELRQILRHPSAGWGPDRTDHNEGLPELGLDPSLRWGDGVVIEGQPLFALWPATLAEPLDHHLAAQPDRSMRGWIAASGARTVALGTQLHNLNTKADLALYCAAEGRDR